jgi:D-tyrosyl-tRNA(Tyr) deacylase
MGHYASEMGYYADETRIRYGNNVSDMQLQTLLEILVDEIVNNVKTQNNVDRSALKQRLHGYIEKGLAT